MTRPLPDFAAGHTAWPAGAGGATGPAGAGGPLPRQGAIAELDAWHRLVICGRPEQVGVARAFVRQVLGDSHPGVERATLLTSELVTNSITHSDSRLDGGIITVTVRPVKTSTGADRIRVEVTDDGGPTAPAMRFDDDLAETGRGLRLVEAYSLRWDCCPDGTRMVTWFECVAEPLA